MQLCELYWDLRTTADSKTIWSPGIRERIKVETARSFTVYQQKDHCVPKQFVAFDYSSIIRHSLDTFSATTRLS